MLSGCCRVVCSLVRSDEPDEKFERTDDEEVDVLLLSSSLEIATGENAMDGRSRMKAVRNRVALPNAVGNSFWDPRACLRFCFYYFFLCSCSFLSHP